MGAVIFTLMATWRRGRELVMREVKQGGLALEPFISSIVTGTRRCGCPAPRSS